MIIKQISIFIENKPGRLEEVTGFLAKEEINLHALSIADTTDFGILRLIVSNPEKAEEVLKKEGFMVKTTAVIAVAMGTGPGSLNKVLKELRGLDVSVEYMYAFTSRHIRYNAIAIFKLIDQDSVLHRLVEKEMIVLEKDFFTNLNTVKN